MADTTPPVQIGPLDVDITFTVGGVDPLDPDVQAAGAAAVQAGLDAFEQHMPDAPVTLKVALVTDPPHQVS
jgi:hypothetical protein